MASVHVAADDPLVADLLLASLELVGEAGGWVAPGTTICAVDGQLHIESARTIGPLLRIPEQLWVSVDDVSWDTTDSTLGIQAIPDDMGELEVPMLYLQVALHNACGKLLWLRATHPVLADDFPSDVTEALRTWVPGFRASSRTDVDVLLANRCFHIARSSDRAPRRMLIPIVDLLNHHGDGAVGDARHAAQGLSFDVDISQPFATPECALDYGMARDALETAAAYGFLDQSATHAHSASVSFAYPEIGTVSISGANREPDGQRGPVRAQVTDAGTELNRLTFRAGDKQAMLDDVIAATGWSPKQAAGVIEACAEANIERLDMLERASDKAPESRSAALIAAAARVQRQNITLSR